MTVYAYLIGSKMYQDERTLKTTEARLILTLQEIAPEVVTDLACRELGISKVAMIPQWYQPAKMGRNVWCVQEKVDALSDFTKVKMHLDWERVRLVYLATFDRDNIELDLYKQDFSIGDKQTESLVETLLKLSEEEYLEVFQTLKEQQK